MEVCGVFILSFVKLFSILGYTRAHVFDSLNVDLVEKYIM